ncbi:hypothetical protein JCM8547_008312 [Rhodosporidiobolus lusitaniae]
MVLSDQAKRAVQQGLADPDVNEPRAGLDARLAAYVKRDTGEVYTRDQMKHARQDVERRAANPRLHGDQQNMPPGLSDEAKAIIQQVVSDPSLLDHYYDLSRNPTAPLRPGARWAQIASYVNARCGTDYTTVQCARAWQRSPERFEPQARPAGSSQHTAPPNLWYYDTSGRAIDHSLVSTDGNGSFWETSRGRAAAVDAYTPDYQQVSR